MADSLRNLQVHPANGMGGPPGSGPASHDGGRFHDGPGKGTVVVPMASSRSILRDSAGQLWREFRLLLTPMVKPQKWVFVVGCYNSGTELLTHLLGSHPSIAALPHEGQFLTDQLPADYEVGLPRMWAGREELFRLTESDTGPNVTRLKKEWLMRLNRSRPVFLEKSPPNAGRTRWLQQHFENAHFIAMVRNGYAVAEGIRRKAEPHHLRDGWPLAQCARQWNRSNEVLLEDAAHLRNLVWVRYEDLAADPARELRRIFAFLALENPGGGELSLEQAWSVHERREPIRDMNAESIQRLTPEELQQITAEARPMLSHFGYPILA